MSLIDAKNLKNEFPDETKGFDVFQIDAIWTEYSAGYEASWMSPRDAEQVAGVFNRFR